jgi:hypothetical protein
MTVPKYPSVIVNLTGESGAAAILGRVTEAMDAAGLPQAEINLFMHAAMIGDHDHLLRTVVDWVVVRHSRQSKRHRSNCAISRRCLYGSVILNSSYRFHIRLTLQCMGTM